MEFTTVGSVGPRASVLGFGCASVGSRHGRRESLRALSRAFELGINYFDVARAYGYGNAEAILGEFIRDKRDRVVVATKFGIDPPASTRARRLVMGLARRVFRLAPGLRRSAGRQLGTQFTPQRFDADAMLRSVEESLRQLRTDSIDVLLVHDCTAEALHDDRLFTALEHLHRAGKVRALGVSGPIVVVAEAAIRRPLLGVAQFRHDVFDDPVDKELAQPTRTSVGFHPFGGEAGSAQMRDVLRVASTDARFPEELRRKLHDTDERAALPALALQGARHNGVDIVVTAMFARDHLEANARAVSSSVFTRAEIVLLREIGRREG